MQIVINIPEKVNNRIRSFLGHGYCIHDEDVKIIAEAIYNGKAQPTVLNAKKLCEFWDSESNFCTLHRPSAQPEIPQYVAEQDY